MADLRLGETKEKKLIYDVAGEAGKLSLLRAACRRVRRLLRLGHKSNDGVLWLFFFVVI